MTDEHSPSAHPTHEQGGTKDTNDLHDIKGVPAATRWPSCTVRRAT